MGSLSLNLPPLPTSCYPVFSRRNPASASASYRRCSLARVCLALLLHTFGRTAGRGISTGQIKPLPSLSDIDMDIDVSTTPECSVELSKGKRKGAQPSEKPPHLPDTDTHSLTHTQDTPSLKDCLSVCFRTHFSRVSCHHLPRTSGISPELEKCSFRYLLSVVGLARSLTHPPAFFWLSLPRGSRLVKLVYGERENESTRANYFWSLPAPKASNGILLPQQTGLPFPRGRTKIQHLPRTRTLIALYVRVGSAYHLLLLLLLLVLKSVHKQASNQSTM